MIRLVVWCLFFFVKQKTAYEMRISDWSSDVCSSDLFGVVGGGEDQSVALAVFARRHAERSLCSDMDCLRRKGPDLPDKAAVRQDRQFDLQIGSASCRARVCQYV